MAQLLSSIFDLTLGTVLLIFVLCTAGALVIKAQIDDPFISYGFQPVLALLSVLIFAGLKASGMIEPLLTADWVKGIMVSTMVGNGVGVGLFMLLFALFSDPQAKQETELTRKPLSRHVPPPPGQKKIKKFG